MKTPTENLALAAAKRHSASDAYAVQLLALQYGVPGAIAELNHACTRLRECKAAVDPLARAPNHHCGSNTNSFT